MVRCILVSFSMLYFFERAGHQTSAPYVSMGRTTAVVLLIMSTKGPD